MKIGPSTSASSYALLRLWAADTTTGLNTALIAEEKVFGNDARWGSSGFPTTWFTLNDPGAPGTAYNLPSLFNITFV